MQNCCTHHQEVDEGAHEDIHTKRVLCTTLPGERKRYSVSKYGLWEYFMKKFTTCLSLKGHLSNKIE